MHRNNIDEIKPLKPKTYTLEGATVSFRSLRSHPASGNSGALDPSTKVVPRSDPRKDLTLHMLEKWSASQQCSESVGGSKSLKLAASPARISEGGILKKC